MNDSLYKYLLQPLLDVIQHVHGDRSDHGDLLGIILEDEDHVKVLQLELDALKVNQLDVAQRHHERRLGSGCGRAYKSKD